MVKHEYVAIRGRKHHSLGPFVFNTGLSLCGQVLPKTDTELHLTVADAYRHLDTCKACVKIVELLVKRGEM